MYIDILSSSSLPWDKGKGIKMNLKDFLSVCNGDEFFDIYEISCGSTTSFFYGYKQDLLDKLNFNAVDYIIISMSSRFAHLRLNISSADYYSDYMNSLEE